MPPSITSSTLLLDPTPSQTLSQILTPLKLLFFLYALHLAYTIRLHALHEYGLVIHEFDPWFNYRATEYLYVNGWDRFKEWFDYMSWYPLGRPVGTTIYPGLQITSVFITNSLAYIVPKLSVFGVSGEWVLSLNDVCCYVPAWFGSLASLMTFLLTYEVSSSLTSSVLSCYIMAIVPAHLMRSIGGGYDNESIALFAMLNTFYFHLRSLRDHTDPKSHSYLYGIITGLAYVYMVAAWGGYVFVLNMIGIHVASLILVGQYSSNLHKAYSMFYLIGTSGAVCIPVVGWTPLKSLEQLGPAFVFAGVQVIAVGEFFVKRSSSSSSKKSKNSSSNSSGNSSNGSKANNKSLLPQLTNAWKLRIKIYAAFLAILIVICLILEPTGYFGPFSSRIRGLFVRHTRTGNPLVDSVAEHQPASSQAYFQYLHALIYVAPVGLVGVLYLFVTDFNKQSSSNGSKNAKNTTSSVVKSSQTSATLFVLLYAGVSYFFSAKMVRLIILTGPVASLLCGWVGGTLVDWGIGAVLGVDGSDDDVSAIVAATATATATAGGGEIEDEENDDVTPSKKSKKKKSSTSSSSSSPSTPSTYITSELTKTFHPQTLYLLKKTLALATFYFLYSYAQTFTKYSTKMAIALSNPSIMFKAQLRSGETIIVDDYREAYFWLRDKTPYDSRVMAWWDYGYQITGIGNRTTIADGNTWNHEHIALLGKVLTAPEKEAHRIARHMADYILIWAGGGGDDLAKSPHMARIANSVYRDVCPGDPTCRQFGFMDRQGTPTPMMEQSLLYKLSGHMQKTGVQIDSNRFQEVFASKYGKVRIFKILKVSKESKDWVADVNNRVCDVEGGWYCKGQYPPALRNVLSGKQDFAQLEDFNRKRKKEMTTGGGSSSVTVEVDGGDAKAGGDGDDGDYQKAYFEHMADPRKGAEGGRREAMENKSRKGKEDAARAMAKAAASANAAADAARDEEEEEEDDYGEEEPQQIRKLTKDELLSIRDTMSLKQNWADTSTTSHLHTLISSNSIAELTELLEYKPEVAYVRSGDGRGPMFWAYEFKREEVVRILLKVGVRFSDVDGGGETARDMKK